MRKVVAALAVSLDGVVESPERWQRRYFDPEMAEIIWEAAERSDAMLLGRRTYEELAEFWPRQRNGLPMSDYMNRTPKHVVSTTLDTFDWENSSLVTGDVREQVAELKRQPGKNIQVNGSPTLVRFLLREGLLDDLVLLVHPVVVGSGRRLFENGDSTTELRLVESRILASGVLSLTYAPAA